MDTPPDKVMDTAELKQFVSEVISASSQYGSESSITYTVSNLVGSFRRYPVYGDYGDLCVLRTYGPWWRKAPSAPRPIPRRQGFHLDDYIELGFEKAVYPAAVAIYETYNPGAIVRISALRHTDPRRGTTASRWFTLWELSDLKPVPHSARRFCPPLRPCPFPTRCIRLEFCHELLHYYTELDAVELIGSATPLLSSAPLPPASLSPTPLPGFAMMSLVDKATLEPMPDRKCPFDTLPDDLLHIIIGYLDLRSLCRASCVSRRFREFCGDPLLDYHLEIDLQPYWSIVTDTALHSLGRQCTQMRSLSLSWCGSYGMVGQAAFSAFLSRCGASLACLRLACCPFVTEAALTSVAHCCPSLKELDIRSCSNVSGSGFSSISSLSKLQHINMYRTSVDTASVIAIVRRCPALEHINLGACTAVKNFDAVAIEISHYCVNLKSADFWRAKMLTDIGLSALAERCTCLRELDLGWCHDIQCTSGVIVRVAQSCPNLVKLFLTANRTLSDRELNALSAHCPDLEQLDVLGTNLITQQGVAKLLQSCTKLQFLDLSFCSGIDARQAYEWNQQYKHCNIKKSYQCS